MDRRLVAFYSIAWRTVVVLLTLQVVWVSAARYLTHSQTPPGVITDNLFANPFLTVHVAAGIIAMLLGPIQFVPAIRKRLPALHRAGGRVYAAAIAVGAPTGLILSLGTAAGPIAGSGFAVLALLWPTFTFLGIRAAIGKKFAEHRKWMLRSYALTAAGLTLRVMLPLAGLLEIPFLPAYQVIAWISWMTNLALVEYYLRRSRRSSARQTRYAMA